MNPFFVFREELDQTALLFNPETGKAWQINKTATLIWKLLPADSLEQLEQKIRDSMSGTPDSLHDDVLALLRQLKEIGAVADD